MDSVSITTITVAVIAFLSLIVTAIVAPVMMVRSQNRARLLEKAADAKLALEASEAERQRLQRDKDDERARQDRKEAEERTRQADVAKAVTEAANRAEETARLLAAEQAKRSEKEAETARLLAENTAKAVATAEALSKTVAQVSETVVKTAKVAETIHTLTNSNLSLVNEDKLKALKKALRYAKKALQLARAAGKDPSADDLADIDSIENQIAETQIVLVERSKQAKIVEADSHKPPA